MLHPAPRSCIQGNLTTTKVRVIQKVLSIFNDVATIFNPVNFADISLAIAGIRVGVSPAPSAEGKLAAYQTWLAQGARLGVGE